MKKTLLLATVVAIAFASASVAAETQKVSLELRGAFCPGCAKALTAALVQGGVKDATEIKANKDVGPASVTGEIAPDADLVKLGTAVNTAKTPHAKQAPPGVSLVLFAKLDKESAEAALKALQEVKGVDATKSKADTKTGQISVKLQGADAAGGAKLNVADVLGALKKAGIEATLSKT